MFSLIATFFTPFVPFGESTLVWIYFMYARNNRR